MQEAAFAELVERHRGELRVHCYRMLGSFEEAEDLVQETFMRAWRARTGLRDEGAAPARAWLYRIATNACLDVLRGKPRRVLQLQGPPADPDELPAPPADLPWLQPYPDALLASAEDDPSAAVVVRETIELAFLAAIQHLPPRQRAVLILRDLLGWSAKQTASMLETSVASANSALQRARATLRDRLPERRSDWKRAEADPHEREVLRRYVDAHERADSAALAALLLADARLDMPPHPVWYDGRDAIVTASAKGFDPNFGSLRALAIGANLQPAAAYYLRPPGESVYKPLAFDVLRIDGGRVASITSFVFPELFPAFGLPSQLDR